MPKSYSHLTTVVPPGLVEVIREAVRTENYIFGPHAQDQILERKISPSEVRDIVLEGMAIEYDDGSSEDPSGVLFNGMTSGGRPLHVKMSERRRGIAQVWVVTVYFPRAEYFEDNFSVRISTRAAAPVSAKKRRMK